MIDRKKIFNKFNGKCAYCGEKLSRMQVDHIIPKRSFKKIVLKKYKVPEFLTHLTGNDIDHEDNLFPACGTCNKWKSDYSLETFRSELGKQTERLNLRSSNYRMAKRYGQLMETENEIIFYFELYKYHKL